MEKVKCNIGSRILDWLINPFYDNFFVLLLLYVLVVGLDIYSACINYSAVSGCLVAICGCAFLYIILLPLFWIVKFCGNINWIKQSLVWCITFLGVILFIVNLQCLLQYKITLCPNLISAVKATNLSEVQEYFHTYVSFETILLCLLVLTLWITYGKCLFHKRLQLFRGCKERFLVLAFILLGVGGMVVRKNVLINLSSYTVLVESVLMDEIPDLREYRQTPTLEITDFQPQNVVLIIGESFAKEHSSLYGYSRCTNPCLEALRNKGELLVYDNVKAPSVYTTDAFRHFMSTYSSSNSENKWYECLNIIDLMKTAGYTTYWFSNQSKTGVHDSEVTRYSQLCDSVYFTNDKELGVRRTTLDEELLPPLNALSHNADTTDTQKNFIIIHLMGSHSAFNMRYPVSYNQFSGEEYSSDYPNLSVKNRQLLAEYDNSIFYNDKVVNELFNIFQNKEAIVFYFSDHGIDAFYSSDDYIGHATQNNESSVRYAKEIPFVIYTTPLYKEKFVDEYQRMSQSLSKNYSTDSLIYTLMDVAGVEKVDGTLDSSRSLLAN